MMDIKEEEKKHMELSHLIKTPVSIMLCKTDTKEKMEVVSQYPSGKNHDVDMSMGSDHGSENICDSTDLDSCDDVRCVSGNACKGTEEQENNECSSSIITGLVTVKRLQKDSSRCEEDDNEGGSQMSDKGDLEENFPSSPDLQNRYAHSAVAALLLSGRYAKNGEEVTATISSNDNGIHKVQQWQCHSCSFATNNFGHYQLHSDYHRKCKAGGKMFQCSKCDFYTNERSKLKLHLHAHNNNQIRVLQCSKCSFSSLISTKFREHLMTVHHVPVPRDIDLNKINKSAMSLLIPPKDDPQGPEPPVSPDSAMRSTSSPILLDALAGRILNHKRPSSVPNGWGQTEERKHLTNQNRSVSSLAVSSSDVLICDKTELPSNQRQPHEQVSGSALEYSGETGFASACLQSIAEGIKSSRGQLKVDQPYSSAIISALTKTSNSSIHTSDQAQNASSRKEITQTITQGTSVSSTSVNSNTPSLYQPWTSPIKSPYQTPSSGPLRPTVVEPEVWRRCYFRDTPPNLSQPYCKVTKTTGIQCNLLESNSTDSSVSENMDTFSCEYCGIIFNDSVIHSIHMGCHSHIAPFVCNVCGHECGNKYAFYTHIMRGHQK